MTQEKFKDLIEAPANCAKRDPGVGVSAHMSYSNAKQVFLRALIGRTVRITLQYPELAQEYLDNLPKAVCENIPTPSNDKS
jgi:hypothetical protein